MYYILLRNLESLKQWKEFPMHLKAQEKGKQKWYEFYQVKICKIEKEYELCKGED